MARAIRRILVAVWSWLHRPLFGTRVIPRDATVDPTLFPEEEYPVYCPKCGYLLRGLPDGKCPECGTEFARGRLLVRQYVVEWSGATWKQRVAARWSLRLSLAGWALPILGGVGMAGIIWLANPASPGPPPPGAFDRLLRLVHIWMGALGVGVLLQVTGLVIALAAYPRGVRKRRRAIIDAIR
jgi:hypothetical protein